MSHDFDPEKFGQVLATLESQNKVLSEMRADIVRLFTIVYDIQTKQTEACKHPAEPKRDYMEIIMSAIMGAVMYFLFAHFIEH